MTFVSIHGNRLGLIGSGILQVDGQNIHGGVPTLGKDVFVDSVTGNALAPLMVYRRLSYCLFYESDRLRMRKHIERHLLFNAAHQFVRDEVSYRVRNAD